MAAGFNPAATCLFRLPNAATRDYLEKSQPYTGKRAAPSRSDRAMRGNHLGSLSFFGGQELERGLLELARRHRAHVVAPRDRDQASRRNQLDQLRCTAGDIVAIAGHD